MTNSYVDQDEIGIEDPMPLGKYKGQMLISILDRDPDYLRWVASEIEKFELCDEILIALESESERALLLEDYANS